MGSPCQIQIYAVDPSVAASAMSAALAEVARLEARYSRYRADSLLSAINRAAADGTSITVDAETASLVDYAATCFAQSDGLFDITAGVLRKAWDFHGGQLPDPQVIDRLAATVGWDKLRWNAPVLAFPVPGMELDLGGVVKEYAADRAAAACRDRGVASGFVNLGGDIAVIGPRPDDDVWRIGLRHPRKPDALLGTIGLHRGGVATSGDYERCIVIDGRYYGHILNPRTGWPGRHLAAVTVAAELCIVAGSASTIAMLEDANGPQWLAEQELLHLWVDVDGQVGGSLAGAMVRTG